MSKETALQLAAMSLAIGVLAWHAWETAKLRGAIEGAEKATNVRKEELEPMLRKLFGEARSQPDMKIVEEKPADA